LNPSIPVVVLPQAPVSEWNAIGTGTPSGLFAYRQMQAIGLLNLPDYGGGDLTADQRREALKRAVNLHKPLAALATFLGVVALEDYVRDLGGRMAGHNLLCQHFPELRQLRSSPKARAPGQEFRRLDTEPISSFEPEDINNRLHVAIGVAPIPAAEYSRLRDLALVRHTVAHHAAVIRPVDVPRFQYYVVHANQLINPPEDFVRETLHYLHGVGRTIDEAIRHRIFSLVLPTFQIDWAQAPPPELLSLLEFFAYFGFIETTTDSVGYAAPDSPLYTAMQAETSRIKARLVERCIQKLQIDHDACGDG
jgi:hypothetical protein